MFKSMLELGFILSVVKDHSSLKPTLLTYLQPEDKGLRLSARIQIGSDRAVI